MSIDTYIPIANLKPGTEYDQVFMIKDASHRKNNNKSYSLLTLQDVTGTISASVWDFNAEKNPNILEPGKFIRLKGLVKFYKEQIVISSNATNIAPYNGQPDNITDYVVCMNNGTLNVYAQEIHTYLEHIEDPYYRDLLNNAQQRLDIISLLKESPYQITGPLAHRGGLLIFTNDLLKFSESIAKNSVGRILYEDHINTSLLTTGCILKNLGWYTTTFFKGDFLNTKDAFHNIGVKRASFRFVHDLMLHTENDLKISIPEAKKQALENLINDDLEDILTVEGKIIYIAEKIIMMLHMADFKLKQKTEDINWVNDLSLFRGHLLNGSI